MEKQWKLTTADPAASGALVTALGVSPILARLLVNRSISVPSDAAAHLAPRLADLLDPFEIHGMRSAVERILAAADAGQSICIWGDYDVDGVTSTTLLMRFFREVGIPARFFVPDRFRHGYGLSMEPIQSLAESGVELLVTVDCGINDIEEVRFARELGVDVIVVDHHEVGPELPPAHAIINPLQPECSFPFKGLAAVGLTFHLLIALRSELRKRGDLSEETSPDLRRFLDVTAIGTIADMVPLVGLNRVLASQGVRRIPESENVGIQALCEVSGGRTRPINAGFVAFQIGPRINAAGRLASAERGVELLISEDYDVAHGLAMEVDLENRRRREIEASILEAALAQVESAGGVGERRALVLHSRDWHAGVTGIVATRIVERHHRPAFLIACEDGVGRGSVRSISGFHVVRALRRCEDLLVTFGGHAHAGGLTIREEHIPEFTQRMEAIAVEVLGESELIPSISIDEFVAFADVDFPLLEDLQKLEPFGMGNRKPLFCTEGVEVDRTRVVKGNHLQLWLRQGATTRRAIAFGRGDEPIAPGDLIDIAYHAEENVWQGRRELQLQVRDLRHNRTGEVGGPLA
jgi:single-stranded-DNA-specific exonuclease